MSRLLKPSTELPLKLLAFDTIDNRDAALQLLASIPPGRSASTATPLGQDVQRRRAPFAEIDGWHHGGLNE
jgi:hypothetical protein